MISLSCHHRLLRYVGPIATAMLIKNVLREDKALRYKITQNKQDQYNMYRVYISIMLCDTFKGSLKGWQRHQQSEHNKIQYNIKQITHCDATQHNTLRWNTINTQQCNATNVWHSNTMEYNGIIYDSIQCFAIQNKAIMRDTEQYSLMQCQAIQDNTMQSNSIQYNILH